MERARPAPEAGRAGNGGVFFWSILALQNRRDLRSTLQVQTWKFAGQQPCRGVSALCPLPPRCADSKLLFPPFGLGCSSARRRSGHGAASCAEALLSRPARLSGAAKGAAEDSGTVCQCMCVCLRVRDERRVLAARVWAAGTAWEELPGGGPKQSRGANSPPRGRRRKQATLARQRRRASSPPAAAQPGVSLGYLPSLLVSLAPHPCVVSLGQGAAQWHDSASVALANHSSQLQVACGCLLNARVPA